MNTLVCILILGMVMLPMIWAVETGAGETLQHPNATLHTLQHGIMVEGNITSDTTWSPESGPYYISKPVSIQGNATLTILPGTMVVFTEGGSILAGITMGPNGTYRTMGQLHTSGGGLRALGTGERPVVFLALNSGSVVFAPPYRFEFLFTRFYDMGGIYILGADDCVIENSVFYGGSGVVLDVTPVLRSFSPSPSNNTIAHCSFVGCENGIYIGDDRPDTGLERNLIYGNNFINCKEDVVFRNGVSYSIWNTTEEGNYWYDYSGVDTDGDGIGDTYLPWHGVDYRPLMEPYPSSMPLDYVRIGCGAIYATEGGTLHLEGEGGEGHTWIMVGADGMYASYSPLLEVPGLEVGEYQITHLFYDGHTAVRDERNLNVSYVDEGVRVSIGPIRNTGGRIVADANVTVSFMDVVYHNRTDSNGTATFTLPHEVVGRNITVRVEKEGYVPVTFRLTVLDTEGRTRGTIPQMRPYERGVRGPYWQLYAAIAMALTGLIILLDILKVYGERVLDHRTRRQIYELIMNSPGTTYSKIIAVFDLAIGQAQHHLRILEREEYIRSVKRGKYRRYYPSNQKARPESFILPEDREIVDYISAHPGATGKDISKEIGRHPSSVYRCLKRLSNDGVIRTERDGKSKRCYLNDGGKDKGDRDKGGKNTGGMGGA